ncbi:MAG TPA: hypothetical protein PKX92_07455 [Edaphocola sp.]|nr:hypothetical protein [Edaphocola sp.]
MKEKEIITNLLIDLKSIEPDYEKFKGNPIPAKAERLIKFINIMTPHAHLFDDNFKMAIKEYILTYEAALKGEAKGINIVNIIESTDLLITSTLERKLQ